MAFASSQRRKVMSETDKVDGGYAKDHDSIVSNILEAIRI